MKNTFHGWSSVNILDLDATADLIVTGRKASEAKPETQIYNYIGEKYTQLNVLDFGCGFGRNTFAMGLYDDYWTIVGYDNDSMLDKVNEFCNLHYGGEIPKNVWFQSDWNRLIYHKFDTIFCCLVLQHIYEDALLKYISDFKNMTSKLIVFGRRFNDDIKKRSTWKIIEENGLTPRKFYDSSGLEITYVSDGDPNEHNLAIYTL